MKLVYKCRECGQPFTTEKGLSDHLRSGHAINIQEYYDKYVAGSQEGKCVVCGEPTTFLSMSKGYRQYCSKCWTTIEKEEKKYEEPQSKVCKVCGYTITGSTPNKLWSRFSLHLRSHKMDSKTYYDNYELKPGEGKCQNCGAPTSFLKLSEGYRKFCINCKMVNGSKKLGELIDEEHQFQAEQREEKRTREEVYNEYVQSLQNEVLKYEWEGERNSWLGGNRTKPNPNRNDLLTDNSISFIDGQSFNSMNEDIDEKENQSSNDVFWL